MRAILQTFSGLITELHGSEFREAIVFAVWPTVIGEQLRERSSPLRLDDKMLFVAVTGREWKREFEQHAGNIVYKLNAALKSSVVERLHFVIDQTAVLNSHGNSAIRETVAISPDPVSQDVSVAAAKIADAELRSNFLKAAAACIGRRDAATK